MHNRAVCRWVEWELSSVQFLLLPFWLKRNSARNFERVVIMASTPVDMQSFVTVKFVFCERSSRRPVTGVAEYYG